MYKSDHFNVKKIITSLFIIFFLIITIQIPLLTNSSYLNTVYNNETQVKFLNLFINFNASKGTLFYIAPAAIILLFFYGTTFKNFNKNLFILFLAFSFFS